jgi:hypothetical protein
MTDHERNLRLGAAFREIQATDAALFDRKQRDYGPGNIGDSWQAFGMASLLVRMNDKMQRLLNLSRTGAAPENESVLDSLSDLANYATIARMCIAGEWPMKEPEPEAQTEPPAGNFVLVDFDELMRGRGQ